MMPHWAGVSLAAALACWIAIPLAGQADLWLQGAILRLVLACWLVYALIVFVLTGTRERLVLLSILLLGAFAQAAFGVFQYLFPDANPHLGWISDLCPERMEGHAFRARGFYYNANHLAWLLNFAGAFALSLGVWGRVGLWPRVLLLYGAAMFFGVGILTQSRGGLLGAGVALGVFVILSARGLMLGAWGVRGRMFGLLALALLVSFGMAWQVYESSDLAQFRILKAGEENYRATVFVILSARGLMLGAWGVRGRMFGLLALALLVSFGMAWQVYESSDLAQFRILKAGEENYRATVWKTALRQWQSEPLLGTGIGTFTNFARQYRFRADALDDVFAHNDWVQALAEIGLIGVALGLCVFFVHLFSGWRGFVDGLCQRLSAGDLPASVKSAMQMGAVSSLGAFAVHSLFDFNMQVPGNALLACVSLAILASPGRRSVSGIFPKIASLTTFATALIAAVWIAWSSWNFHQSEFAWIKSDAAFSQGNSESALHFAESGLLSNPKHSALAATGGRAALSLGKNPVLQENDRRRLLERSIELSSLATNREPGDAWYLINLAHAHDNLGNFEQAAPLHRAAIAKAPYYATPYEFYALHLELSGSIDEAISYYALALNLPGPTFSMLRREALIKAQR